MSEETEARVLQEVVAIIKDMTSDWELDSFSGEISATTQLVADLSFQSIEILQLMTTIEQHFRLKNLAAEQLLMQDGKYVKDRSIGEVAAFVSAQLQRRA